MSDCARLPYTWTAGDTLPEIVMSLDETDLSGYTVELILRRPDGSELVKVATSILNSPEVSKFSFAWVASDLQAGIGQEAAVRFTVGALVEHTEHLIIDVQRAP